MIHIVVRLEHVLTVVDLVGQPVIAGLMPRVFIMTGLI